MTGLEFINYVKKVFKRSDKDTELYQCTTDVVVDMRMSFLSDDFKEEAYISGISSLGDYKIGLPADFGHIFGKITIRDTSTDEVYVPIVKISKDEYDSLYFDRLSSSVGLKHTGVPQHFCVFGGQILLGPVPDKTTYQYQINYTTEDAEEVTSATDPVPFTDKYRRILRFGVLEQIFLVLQNFNESQIWGQKYKEGMEKIINSEDFSESSGGSIVYRGLI